MITEDFWLAINQLEFMVRRGMARIKAEYGEYISSNAAATDAVVVPAIANGETPNYSSKLGVRLGKLYQAGMGRNGTKGHG